MKIKLSVPSKTFLVGEYLALWGGPSLILATEPRFELIVNTDGQGVCQGIHPQSPAGRWLRQNNTAFQMADIEFIDPHFGQGGWGASSAQFDLVYAWSQMSGLALGSDSTMVDPEKLWQAYRTITWTDQGAPPSGADVTGQFNGHISYFTPSPFQLEALSWPFPEQDFILFRTGQKVTTHKHLSEVQKSHSHGLQDIVLNSFEALKKKRWPALCDSVNAYQTALQKQSWVSTETQFKISQLLNDSRIHAIKGCGALGADVIMVLCDIVNTEVLKKDLFNLDLNAVATSKNISNGFGVQMDYQVSLLPAEV